MGVRGKLATIFLVLLAAAILAVSALEIDHVTRVMVDDLGDSGAMLIDQTFEQIRPLIARSGADFQSSLRTDRALHAFLNSFPIQLLHLWRPAGNFFEFIHR